MIRIDKIVKPVSTKKMLHRTVLYGVLALAAGLLFATCMEDRAPWENTGEEGEAWVAVTIRLPQPSVPASRQADAEVEISNIRILIFELDTGIYRFSYQVSGNELTPVGDGSTFRALLRAVDTPLKLMILANVEESLAAYEPAEGATEADIREQLELPFPAEGLSGNLPMYGETLLPNGIGSGENHVQLNALRAIARVDVRKQLEEGSGDFILEEVQIFRVYNRLRLIPNETLDPAAPKVTVPSVPEDAGFLSSSITKSVVGGTDSITHIYIPESYAAGEGISELNGTTVIVVGGRFAGSNQTTYYRADFDPGVEGHPFGQVLRNYRYTFIIKRVSAQGWSSPVDAANNFATSLVVEVQAWEDFSSELYFGENRFAVSSREISLPYIENRHGQIDVESTLPYTIQWLDANGNPVGQSTSAQDVDISNANFRVRIIKESGDSETASHLQFWTLNNNAAGSTVITNTLRITVDNWTVDITVRQDNRAVYSDFYINVVSARPNSYDVGNLGTTTIYPTYDATFSWGGLGMRMILDRRFLPGDVVKIGGFRFEEITASTHILMSSTNQADLNALEQFLDMQDVIYLTYNVAESPAAAQLVLNWLNKSTKRVLILGTDNATTNANVVSLLSGDATWLYNNLSDGYVTATATVTDQNRVFFEGPFGTVNLNTTVNKYDGTAGHSQTHSPDVIPLIVSDSNNAIMYFGVNKIRRIVYHGDANLYHTNQLSNHNGNVTSNTDKLMANVWAWIVDQVIYGDD